jgi:hypothetical protein
MRKLLLLLMVLCVAFMMIGVAMADDTINGYVSDSSCGVKGANADHAACAKKCVAKGAKLVIVTDGDQKVLTVDNPDALVGHEGHHVAISGTTSGDSVHVGSVKML